jgi:NAD(P)H dehydrogenase (quinone)
MPTTNQAGSKRALIILAHPDTDNSFNHAIAQQVKKTLEEQLIEVDLLDLYVEGFNPVMSREECRGKAAPDVAPYQERIKQANYVLFVYPVWWSRAPAILEGFIDRVFIPGFAYRFRQLFGVYGMPIPLLKEKKVLAILTHGAPELPVKTIYFNSVLLRFRIGFLSFCFKLFKTKVIQLWSVPFIDDAKRSKYLEKVTQAVKKFV